MQVNGKTESIRSISHYLIYIPHSYQCRKKEHGWYQFFQLSILYYLRMDIDNIRDSDNRKIRVLIFKEKSSQLNRDLNLGIFV